MISKHETALGELTSDQIEALLHAQVIGRIAFVDGDDVVVLPISYVYDGDRLICHSRDGQKTRAMRARPRVCFETEEVCGLTNWRSVVARGVYRELVGDEAASAMSLFVGKLSPLVASEHRHAPVGSLTPSSGRGAQAIVFCIESLEKTGRFEAR